MNTTEPFRPEERQTAEAPLLTGSQSPDRIVSARRRRDPLRLSRRRDHPRLRRALRLSRPAAPHPRAPRAGRRPAAQGYARVSGRVGDLPGHLRPGCDEHRDRTGRRADGLHAAGARHRTGRFDTAGNRRLSGDQLRRDHAGRHEMELPGQIPRRDSGGHRQSLLHPPVRGARAPSWSTSPRTPNAQRRPSATNGSPRSAATHPPLRPTQDASRKRRGSSTKPGGRWR